VASLTLLRESYPLLSRGNEEPFKAIEKAHQEIMLIIRPKMGFAAADS